MELVNTISTEKTWEIIYDLKNKHEIIFPLCTRKTLVITWNVNEWLNNHNFIGKCKEIKKNTDIENIHIINVFMINEIIQHINNYEILVFDLTCTKEIIAKIEDKFTKFYKIYFIHNSIFIGVEPISSIITVLMYKNIVIGSNEQDIHKVLNETYMSIIQSELIPSTLNTFKTIILDEEYKISKNMTKLLEHNKNRFCCAEYKECIICYEKKKTNYFKCCNQQYCDECIDKWFQTNQSCPHCRKQNPEVMYNTFILNPLTNLINRTTKFLYFGSNNKKIRKLFKEVNIFFPNKLINITFLNNINNKSSIMNQKKKNLDILEQKIDSYNSSKYYMNYLGFNNINSILISFNFKNTNLIIYENSAFKPNDREKIKELAEFNKIRLIIKL